ncbi:uncharacterized protein E5676_scaffold648G001320 [Cucumis melo var. makuwa]|uniref:Uncharacterized protein n=1 Tax=Cucumis melo var. makuwa TaxID=1194695 RepID=A0A5D3CAV0_CUCMM|nr:uncharacterized protein E6C27_scaffold115G001800 [Cucumis melo var. makuwa]TYK08334.1 uncharacterized protein E5676_scaffold648G001320 [Cucumis melo var. makuwa]
MFLRDYKLCTCLGMCQFRGKGKGRGKLANDREGSMTCHMGTQFCFCFYLSIPHNLLTNSNWRPPLVLTDYSPDLARTEWWNPISKQNWERKMEIGRSRDVVPIHLPLLRNLKFTSNKTLAAVTAHLRHMPPVIVLLRPPSSSKPLSHIVARRRIVPLSFFVSHDLFCASINTSFCRFFISHSSLSHHCKRHRIVNESFVQLLLRRRKPKPLPIELPSELCVCVRAVSSSTVRPS